MNMDTKLEEIKEISKNLSAYQESLILDSVVKVYKFYILAIRLIKLRDKASKIRAREVVVSNS